MFRIFKHLNGCTNAFLSLNTKMSFKDILKLKFTFQLWSKEAVINAVETNVLPKEIKNIFLQIIPDVSVFHSIIINFNNLNVFVKIKLFQVSKYQFTYMRFICGRKE